MLHFPDGVWLVVGGAGLFLAGLLTAIAVKLLWGVLVNALAAAIVKAQPAPVVIPAPAPSRHSKDYVTAVALSERQTGILLDAIEDGQVQYARLQNALLLAEWVHNNGHPDAPWSEIVKWKQNKGVTK